MTGVYVVPNVPLIPQDKRMSCWFASAQMLIQWRRELKQATEGSYSDPAEIPAAVRVYQANNGLKWEDMINFAHMLGLEPVPLVTPSLEAIGDWLKKYGPIWAAGQKVVSPDKKYGHVFVIVGIVGNCLFIHDPEPVNKGTKAMKSAEWVAELLEWGSDGTFKLNFMHFPDSAC